MSAPDFLRRQNGGRSTAWFDGIGTPSFRRFFIQSGVGADSPGANSPSAGGNVDGVEENSVAGVLAHRGSFAKVEAGGSISSGDDLATDGNGRAVTAGSGDTVFARALEGASSGNVFWIAFTGA